MSFPQFIKDPDARLDYEVDWSEWLPTGDAITASLWECEDAALVLDDEQFDTNSATVFASAGVLGTTYFVVNRIETGQGRINDQTIRIKIKTT